MAQDRLQILVCRWISEAVGSSVLIASSHYRTFGRVLIFDTQRTTPLAVIENIHITPITDVSVCWRRNQLLIACSSRDGYVTLIEFDEADLCHQSGGQVFSDEEFETFINLRERLRATNIASAATAGSSSKKATTKSMVTTSSGKPGRPKGSTTASGETRKRLTDKEAIDEIGKKIAAGESFSMTSISKELHMGSDRAKLLIAQARQIAGLPVAPADRKRRASVSSNELATEVANSQLSDPTETKPLRRRVAPESITVTPSVSATTASTQSSPQQSFTSDTSTSQAEIVMVLAPQLSGSGVPKPKRRVAPVDPNSVQEQ